MSALVESSLYVAHVVPIFHPRPGGMGRVAHEYAAGLNARGHVARVLTPRYRTPGEDNGDDAGLVTRPWSLARFGNAAFLPSLCRSLRGFDLVHLHYPFFGGAEPVLLRKLVDSSQALIVTYHMDAVAAGVKGALFRLHHRWVLPRVMARADRVLVSSLDYATSSQLARVPGLIERVEVHPFGVDAERFHPGDEPALRSRLGLLADETMLLFVGGLDPAHHFKGLPILLDALRRLRALRWRLVVVGDGPQRAGFAALSHAHDLADRVHYAGAVSDEDLPRFYRAADVHLLPSTGRGEAFGLVSLEAAASGTPSIVSSLPGVRTLVLDQRTGLHVPPGDPDKLCEAVRFLIEHAEARTELGRAARQRVLSEYAWPPLIARLEATYRHCLAELHLRNGKRW